MESNTPFSRQRRPAFSDRFLDLLSQSSPPDSVVLGGAGDELSEDDIFLPGESVEPNDSPSTSSVFPQPPHPHHLAGAANKGFGGAENFGILAALPEFGQERSSSGRSVLNHNTSILPSVTVAAASSRKIPVIPRPLPDRTYSMSVKSHQSAPVNVPMMARDDLEWRCRKLGSGLKGGDGVGGSEDDEDRKDGVMLPPHEIVAKQPAKTPILSCSVSEGAGRTLKGRDLRRVRNAVFRQTGFID